MIGWLLNREARRRANRVDSAHASSGSNSKRTKRSDATGLGATASRTCQIEQLESRRVLSADPISVGAVYIEDDSGTDNQGDQFYVSFEGGSDTTLLDRVVINTSQDGNDAVLGEPDVYFDTIDNGAAGNIRGSGGAHGFHVSDKSVGITASDVQWTVLDGGTRIVIDIEDFRAGDKLIFSIDVDQFFANKPDDQVTSGIEFAGSQLETQFVDKHYHFSPIPEQNSGVFQYNFDFGSDDVANTGLLSGLPSEQYRLASNNFESIENRTAGALDRLSLTPKPVTISGTVFHDRDFDLEQDAGDEGIEGVLLRLQVKDALGNYVDIPNGSSSTTTTLTDANGDYHFGESLHLLPGTYRVLEVQPTDFEYSVGEIPGTVEGNDVGTVETTNVLAEIEIPLGDQHAVDYDFAEAKAAKISGYVYHDRNDNGIREAGEEGLEGVQIRVIPINTILSQTPTIITTDADGYYCVDGLAPGEYRVEEVSQPTEYLDGKDTAGTINGVTVGSANNPGDDIEGIVLLSDQTGLEYNFGEIRFGSLSGHVFLATPNGDCVGPGHPDYRAIEGVEIKLSDLDGKSWTAYTDQNGHYSFVDLAPGTYTIVEVTHPDFPYLNGDTHVGTINGSTVGSLTGVDTIGQITLAAGEHGVNYDFCEHDPASLAGHVFHDRNNDGIWDPGEEGIAGVKIELYDGSGMLIQSTMSDASGAYQFTGLYAGEYCVKEIQPVGFVDGIDLVGTVDGSVVGNLAPGGDKIQNIDLLGGQSGVQYDFGEYKLSTIDGIVHTDINGDCTFDPSAGESPLAGVLIDLLDSNGNVIDSTVTDADGRYRFEGITPGSYSVRQTQPAGYFHGGQIVGYHVGNGNPGSGDGSQSDFLSDIVFVSDTHFTQYNFCELPPASISGYVFKDGATIRVREGVELTPNQIANRRDGLLTSDDTRIAGVVIELRHGITGLPIEASEVLPGVYSSGPIRTVTDANGFYQFTGLPAGNYAVFEVHPAGYIDHLDTPGTTLGVAVNAVKPPSEFILSTLDHSVDPRFDAILRIAVGVGDQSRFNNFSEVVIEERTNKPPIAPPPFDPARPDPPPLQRGFVPPPEYTYIDQLPVREDPMPIYGGVEAMDYTWHLSVIDGGVPRGRGDLVAGLDDPTRSVAFSSARGWDDTDVDQGKWIISFNDAANMSDQFEGTEIDFGLIDGIPVVGDFNGDGVDEVAVYRDGHWFVDLNGNGTWDEFDLWARLGNVQDRPVVGDWDGDGKDDIGIFGPIWMGDPRAIEMEPGLPDSDNEGFAKAKNVPPTIDEATVGKRVMRLTSQGDNRVDVIDHVFRYGEANDSPITGDWNGDGIRSIGVFNNGEWRLDLDGNGRFTEKDAVAHFGEAGDIPVTGDFNGDGIDEIGVFRDGKWMLDTDGSRELEAHDAVFEMGHAGDLPVAGDFDGDGVDEAVIYRTRPNAE